MLPSSEQRKIIEELKQFLDNVESLDATQCYYWSVEAVIKAASELSRIEEQ